MNKIFQVDNKAVFDFLKKQKLIYTTYKCKLCDVETKLSERKISDGFGFRCTKSKDPRCKKNWYTVRMDSFFYDMKLKLTEVMQLIYYWALQVKVKDIKGNYE